MSTNPDKARQMWDQLVDGKVLFRHQAGQWLILGNADTVVTGRIVTVTQADGTTQQVMVGKTHTPATRNGLTLVLARFHRVHTAAPRDPSRPFVGCHYCGLELDRHGECPECGSQKVGKLTGLQ